jgi:hypothetical protein
MLTDSILHVLYTLARWRFILVPVFIVVPLILVSSRLVQKHASCLGLLVALISIPLGIILGIANFLGGPQLSVLLIHRYGVRGEATVTGTYSTNTSYNDRQVMGHNVLIKTAARQTIESSFEDDDFNVYPPANGVYYPQDGDMFNVSYIKNYPEDFIIIISDDDSPWARSLRCSELMSTLHEADNKRQFAPNSQGLRGCFASRSSRRLRCQRRQLNGFPVYGNETNSTQFGFLPAG